MHLLSPSRRQVKKTAAVFSVTMMIPLALLARPAATMAMTMTMTMTTSTTTAFVSFGRKAAGSPATAASIRYLPSEMGFGGCGTAKNAIGSSSSLWRVRKSMASFSSSSSARFAALSGNLVSVDDCLAAFDAAAETDGDGKVGRTVFVDGSWHLSPDRDGRTEYEAGPRIAGARFFDIDDVASKKGGGDDGSLNPKGLPHMMPPRKLFGAAMDALDIKNIDSLVVYGTEGCMITARAFYTIRAMGHPADKVHLMQGSLAEWISKGGEIETGPKKALLAADLDLSKEPTYTSTEASSIVDMDEVLKVVANAGSADNDVVIDARSAARFRAEAPEPRKGLRGGHMPGSFNVPVSELLDANDPTKLRPANELREAFERGGVDVDTEQRVICTCGSGVTACTLAVALEACGRDPASTFIFDGSWVEWGSDPNTPILP